MARVTRESFAALVVGQPERLADELSPALEAVRDPRAELVLERAGAEATCWVGDDAACLLVPEADGVFRAFSLDFDELPVALLRAVGARAARAPDGGEVTVPPGELAGALARVARGEPAGERLAPVLDGFTGHWRIADGARAVEVIHTEGGCWAVEPTGEAVGLRPVDGAWIARAMTELLDA